jgi:site-specific DNA-methyltransferase (adenine-specific)
MNIDIRLGDCLEVLKTIPDNSIDSVVTDSPYGLSFMGKKWDYDVPSVEVWVECLRVLKPGGHLLSFAGSRTYHRMAVRIEDAGFEIRDQIMWVYGSGFPKSHNIGKAIDKIEGNERKVVDMTFPDGSKPRKTQQLKTYNENEKYIGAPQYTKGNSDWEGWGTALKPAHEPIVMARKPLSEKSIAENVLKHGTGGINIDGSRIEFEDTQNAATNPKFRKENNYKMPEAGQESNGAVKFTSSKNEYDTSGRFPANIIFDEEAGQLLDEQSGISKSTASKGHHRKGNTVGDQRTSKGAGLYGDGNWIEGSKHNDKGGASRFFYCPKAAKKDRDEGLDDFEEKVSPITNFQADKGVEYRMENGEITGLRAQPAKSKNNHPTVKPTDLMRYLINLVTPPNGTILDPFMGSGSTGKAAVRCGVNFIGIEKEQEYMDIASARIEHEKNKPVQTKLFDSK